MSKIVWLGASTVRAIDYGGVLPTQSFAYLTSQFYGYDMTNPQIDAEGHYRTNGFVNAGNGSDGSTQMLARLAADVIAESPTVCAVNAGGLGDQYPIGGGASIPIETYRTNVTSIFTQLKAAGIKAVAINDCMKRGDETNFHGLQPYMLAYEEIAQQMGIPNVDVYREYAIEYILDLGTSGAFDAIFGDGGNVHPSIAGHAWIASVLSRPRYYGVFT